MRLSSSIGLAVTLMLVAAGCGESTTNRAPILDYVDSPAVVSAQHGTYTIPVSVGFHDLETQVITRVHYRLPPSIDEFVEITTPIPTRETADVVLVIPAPMSGSTDQRLLEITVITERGAESLPLPRSVTFQ